MQNSDKYLKREKMVIDISPMNIINHIHSNKFLDMGDMDEKNIFLEAEGEEETEAPTEAPTPAQPEESGEQPSADPEGEVPPDDLNPMADTEVEEEDELLEGLPKDKQYYVIILKGIHRKLLKLKEVSLKLLSSRNEKEEKLIKRIDSFDYIFNRFIEQYVEFENPKNIIMRLQKTIDTMVKFVSNYLKVKK
jgi:hypothetical protein